MSSSCDTNYFNCGDNTVQCIPWPWVCDNDHDCNDGSDESLDLCTNKGKCGGYFSSPNGLIMSPSYPDNYPDNQDCTYKISQPTGTYIVLIFHVMDISGSDYLQIRDGSSSSSLVLENLCGNNITLPIRSSQNHVWLK